MYLRNSISQDVPSQPKEQSQMHVSSSWGVTIPFMQCVKHAKEIQKIWNRDKRELNFLSGNSVLSAHHIVTNIIQHSTLHPVNRCCLGWQPILSHFRNTVSILWSKLFEHPNTHVTRTYIQRICFSWKNSIFDGKFNCKCRQNFFLMSYESLIGLKRCT